MIKCKEDLCVKFKFCCVECSEFETCEVSCTDNPDDCGLAVFEGTEIEIFQNKAKQLTQRIGELVLRKAEIEAEEKTMREQLQSGMEKHGVKQFENNVVRITYIDESTRSSVDSKMLKDKYPDIASECSKTSNVKAYVKIEVKK